MSIWASSADALGRFDATIGVLVEDILDDDRSRRQGATASRAFEEVRALPRHQQLKVVELVQVLLEQHKRKAS